MIALLAVKRFLQAKQHDIRQILFVCTATICFTYMVHYAEAGDFWWTLFCTVIGVAAIWAFRSNREKPHG